MRARPALPLRLLAVLMVPALAACAEVPSEPDGSEPIGEATEAITVAQAANSSCSTLVVKGLSEQIVAEANCISPGAYLKVPSQPNLSMASTVFPYMEQPARDALVATLQAHAGTSMSINSMLRTVAQQYLLYRWYLNGQCGIGLAAKPGSSNHETGLAFDVNEYTTWKSALTAHGFQWLGASDPVHYDYVGAGAVSYKGTDIKAFQMLWNLNHPNDLIAEDGQYGPATESRLQQSPADGFATGPSCVAGAPDVYPSAQIDGAKDEFQDGASQGTIDLFEGEPHTLRLLVQNKGSGSATNVDVVVSLEGLVGSDYLIESDWQHPGTFAENDANQAPENPAHGTALQGVVAFKLNALSPNETKRVTIQAKDGGYSIGKGETTRVRFWVKDIPSWYHQDDYDGAANDVQGSQKFNGGKLQVELPFEVYSRTHWEFDADEREGWSPLGPVMLTPDTANGVLGFASTGDDPGALGPGTSFSAAEYRAVALRARRTGGTGDAKLYFATDAEPAMSEDKSIGFSLPDDGAFHDVVLDAGSEPKWTGTIVQLRLDPFESGDGDVAIDYVRALTDAAGVGGGGAGGGEPSTTGQGGGGGAGDATAGAGGEGPTGMMGDAAGEAGCTCSAAGGPDVGSSWLPGMVGLIAAAGAMRRRRARRSC